MTFKIKLKAKSICMGFCGLLNAFLLGILFTFIGDSEVANIALAGIICSIIGLACVVIHFINPAVRVDIYSSKEELIETANNMATPPTSKLTAQ